MFFGISQSLPYSLPQHSVIGRIPWPQPVRMMPAATSFETASCNLGSWLIWWVSLGIPWYPLVSLGIPWYPLVSLPQKLSRELMNHDISWWICIEKSDSGDEIPSVHIQPSKMGMVLLRGWDYGLLPTLVRCIKKRNTQNESGIELAPFETNIVDMNSTCPGLVTHQLQAVRHHLLLCFSRIVLHLFQKHVDLRILSAHPPLTDWCGVL